MTPFYKGAIPSVPYDPVRGDTYDPVRGDTYDPVNGVKKTNITSIICFLFIYIYFTVTVTF